MVVITETAKKKQKNLGCCFIFKDWLVGWLVDVFMEKQGKEDVLGSAFSRFSINFVQQTFFSYARFFSVLFWNQKSNGNKNEGLMIKSNERKVWNVKKIGGP